MENDHNNEQRELKMQEIDENRNQNDIEEVQDEKEKIKNEENKQMAKEENTKEGKNNEEQMNETKIYNDKSINIASTNKDILEAHEENSSSDNDENASNNAEDRGTENINAIESEKKTDELTKKLKKVELGFSLAKIKKILEQDTARPKNVSHEKLQDVNNTLIELFYMFLELCFEKMRQKGRKTLYIDELKEVVNENVQFGFLKPLFDDNKLD